jgi:hypothetical protein
LLLGAGVPFHPDLLLLPDWDRKLKAEFDRWPRLREVLAPGSRLDGVYIAGTLMLPGRVDLDGETVILARRILFESATPVIRTHFHGFHFFPIDTVVHNDPSLPPGYFPCFEVGPEEKRSFTRPSVVAPRDLADGKPHRDRTICEGSPQAQPPVHQNGSSKARPRISR